MANQTNRVLVLDSQPFRRACLVRFLEPWAQTNKAEIVALDPSDLMAPFDDQAGFRLVLVSVGGASLRETRFAQTMKILRVLAPDAALTVMADGEVADEVRAALALGLDGYLPTALKPEDGAETRSHVAGARLHPQRRIVLSAVRDPQRAERSGAGVFATRRRLETGRCRGFTARSVRAETAAIAR